jgi:hypothetical protein
MPIERVQSITTAAPGGGRAAASWAQTEASKGLRAHLATSHQRGNTGVRRASRLVGRSLVSQYASSQGVPVLVDIGALTARGVARRFRSSALALEYVGCMS